MREQQHETAMDIALRKDLIEIQELIANPPASSSGRQRRAVRPTGSRHKSGSQLELLLGSLARSGEQLLCSQLYSASRPLPAGPNQHKPLQSATRPDQRHAEASQGRRRKSSGRHPFRSHDFQHRLLLSDQEDDQLDEHHRDELEIRRAMHAGRSSVEPTRTARQLARDSNVTPVDAGPTSGRRRVGCQFTSESALNSAGLNERAVDVGSAQQLAERAARALPLRRLRTRTLVAGLERGGLEELERQRKLQGASPLAQRSSSSSERRSLAEQLQDLTPQAAAQGRTQQRAEPDQLGPLEASAHLKRQRRSRASPSGSARSSTMSKARTNRLVLKQRRLTDCASPPTTGGKLSRCIGNLSLLQLRNMVNRRAAQRKKQEKRLQGEEEQAISRKRATQEQSSQEARHVLEAQREQEWTANTSGGRRQERLRRELQTAGCSRRAPNGAKLLHSRPLAPLDDETQLYAIPRKNLKTGAGTATAGGVDAPAKQQVAGELAKLNQVDAAADADRRALANDGGASAPQDTDGQQSPGSLRGQPSDSQAEAQLPLEQRTIKAPSSATTTLDLVERANSLAASALEPQQTRQLGASGPALTGSDSGHSLSTASSTLKPVGEHHKQQQQQQQQQKHQETENGGAAADDASNLSAAGSSCDLSSSASNSSGQHQAASLSCGSPSDGQNNDVHRVHCNRREPPANLADVRNGDNLDFDERDFCVPSYSVVRAASRSRADALEETCRCPLGLDEEEPESTGKSLGSTLRANSLRLKSEPIGGLLSEVEEAHRQGPKCRQGEEPGEDDGKLIRPKSALGGANAELIAAQKSLAAAAVAKVQRDRQAKLLARSKQESESPNEQSATSCRLLTVETTNEPSLWMQAQHDHYARAHKPLAHVAHQQQNHLAASAAVASGHSRPASGPMIGTMMNIITSGPAGSHRSGTNSVGMSDSSPSNNGAESDNSIQTTTSGSLNTTASDGTTGATSKSAASKSGATSAGPFGILSRILLHNSSKQQAKQAASKATNRAPSTSGKQQNGRPLPAPLPAPASNRFNGSISSSSAMSSPSISNGLPTSRCSPDDASSTAAASTAAEQAAKPKLGQLSSRSRQPIVLTNSSELVSNGKPIEPEARFAPKGVLKNGASRNYGERHELAGHPSVGQSDALANGLPRVASYTQLSQQEQQQEQQQAQHANLCDYHALNRSHMIQAKYSPYLPYNLGRYSIHETCDPSSNAHCGQHQFAHYSSMANHALAAYSCADLASAYHNTADLLNNTTSDTSMVCNYSHDHSAIYIPAHLPNGAALNGHHYDQHHGQSATNPAGGPKQLLAARSAHEFNTVTAYVPQHTQNSPTSTHLVHYKQQLQQQQRPRSSLDSILLHSARGHPNEIPQDQSYGQLQKCNGQQQAPTRAILAKRYSNQLNLAPQSSNPALRCDDFSDQQCHQSETSHFNVTQNSIYAGQSMLPLKSELTVLPAGSNGVTVKRLEHDAQSQEQANRSLEKTTKHKSLVKVNLQMFEHSVAESGRDPAPILPPKTVASTGKRTTRVAINQDWKQAESGAEIVTRSEANEEEFDDFSGATVL